MFVTDRPDKTKITKFDSAIGVDKNIGRFKVPVNDKSSVEVLESFGHLINDESDVYIFENILGYNIVQIGLHKLEYQIDVLVVVSSQCVYQFYYIRMLCLF